MIDKELLETLGIREINHLEYSVPLPEGRKVQIDMCGYDDDWGVPHLFAEVFAVAYHNGIDRGRQAIKEDLKELLL